MSGRDILLRLRRELQVFRWERRFRDHEYAVILQLPRGGSWGRRGMRQRIVADAEHVDARYCSPWCGKKALERAGFPRLSPLFISAPAIVIFGVRPDSVFEATSRSRDLLKDRAILAGGKVGDRILTRDQWAALESGPSELQLWAELVSHLNQNSIPRVLHRSIQELASSIDQSTGRISALMDRHAHQSGVTTSP
uniref:Uncharacterized protein n=1 Tax=Compsopogon caeruleus TaxID=31354 RepID=A0A7S1XET6_9RHOD|mmetsp:Transcript_18185/g.37905  ORF Transcript_18185/g.37905 Transcript_18185/m.37905 type:complete len:195 (+) Transcript_18185:177-761(+)